jgi:predicted signal transduction protein with EAL and GGDEF domain
VPTEREEPDVLLRNADQAMLIAKQSGRSRCSLFDTELEGRARALYQTTANVERASRKVSLSSSTNPG